MREKYYRAWTGSKMIYRGGALASSDEGHLLVREINYNHRWWESNPYVDTHFDKESIDWEWMDSTGMVDMHNHPIFEGDVVMWSGDHDSWLAEVLWDEAGARWAMKEPGIDSMMHHAEAEGFRLRSYVAGNKYQHPELLRETDSE